MLNILNLELLLRKYRGDRSKSRLAIKRHVSPDVAVFPSRKGKIISTRNFAKRGWRSVLDKLAIDYRRPYISRHTNATIAMFEYGENPGSVAQRLGHDPRTLFRNYLGDHGKPNAPPDFLSDDEEVL
jgi:integrase